MPEIRQTMKSFFIAMDMVFILVLRQVWGYVVNKGTPPLLPVLLVGIAATAFGAMRTLILYRQYVKEHGSDTFWRFFKGSVVKGVLDGEASPYGGLSEWAVFAGLVAILIIKSKAVAYWSLPVFLGVGIARIWLLKKEIAKQGIEDYTKSFYLIKMLWYFFAFITLMRCSSNIAIMESMDRLLSS